MRGMESLMSPPAAKTPPLGDFYPGPAESPQPAKARAVTRRMAIIGAGPAGLALAHACARQLGDIAIHVFDTRPLDQDLRRDPPHPGLGLGSVMWSDSRAWWAEGWASPSWTSTCRRAR